MCMSENENTDIHNLSLIDLFKCVCLSPKQMNIFAVVLANSLACNMDKNEILNILQFLGVLCTALRSYL